MVFQMLLPALHHFLGSTAKGGSLARAVGDVFFGDAVEGMEVVLGGSEEKVEGMEDVVEGMEDVVEGMEVVVEGMEVVVEGMEVVLGGSEEKAVRLLFFRLDDFLVEG
jgi:hypothetical protein